MRDREIERLKKEEGEEREHQSTIEASLDGEDTGDKLVVGKVQLCNCTSHGDLIKIILK